MEVPPPPQVRSAYRHLLDNANLRFILRTYTQCTPTISHTRTLRAHRRRDGGVWSFERPRLLHTHYVGICICVYIVNWGECEWKWRCWNNNGAYSTRSTRNGDAKLPQVKRAMNERTSPMMWPYGNAIRRSFCGACSRRRGGGATAEHFDSIREHLPGKKRVYSTQCKP